jgi:hypothetical protein
MSNPAREVAWITAPEVWSRLRGGEDLLLVCAGDGGRSPCLPGALSLADLAALKDDPRREIVLFSAGPGDDAATRRAEEYRRRGHANVRCVEGGAAALRASLDRAASRRP